MTSNYSTLKDKKYLIQSHFLFSSFAPTMAQNEERTADDSAYSEELSAAAAPNVVQGTAESMISKLENSMMAPPDPSSEEGDLLQSSEPGPLDKEGKDVEDVLGIISQSIFRAGEGHSLMKLSDRTSLLSVVSHSLSAYITTLEPAPLQRLSARIASEVSLWLCDLFKFTNGAAYCHDDTREGIKLNFNMYRQTVPINSL